VDGDELLGLLPVEYPLPLEPYLLPPVSGLPELYLLPDGLGVLPPEYFGGDGLLPDEYFGGEEDCFGPDEYFGCEELNVLRLPKLLLRPPKLLLLRELNPLLLRPDPYLPASAWGDRNTSNAETVSAAIILRNINPPLSPDSTLSRAGCKSPSNSWLASPNCVPQRFFPKLREPRQIGRTARAHRVVNLGLNVVDGVL